MVGTTKLKAYGDSVNPFKVRISEVGTTKSGVHDYVLNNDGSFNDLETALAKSLGLPMQSFESL